MRPDELLVLTVTMALWPCSGGLYRTDYLQDSCSCTALHKLECDDFMLAPVIGGAGHVTLSRSAEFTRPFYCQFTIRAPEEMKVKLTIHNITIPLSKSCKAGLLSVYDGVPSDIKGWPLTGICGNYSGERYIYSKENALTIYYYQDKGILRERKFINFTYSYYKPVTGRSECPEESKFLCQSLECIPKTLECDGVVNCDDGSDETEEIHLCRKYTSSNPTVGVAVGGVLALVVVSALVAALVLSMRRKQESFSAQRRPTEPVRCPNPCQATTYQNDHSRQSPPPPFAVQNTNSGDVTRSPEVTSLHYGVPERPPSYSSLFPDV